MDNQDIKKYILHVGGFLLACFMLLLANLLYIQVIEADELAENPLNRRGNANDVIRRGAIIDARGELLAVSPELGTREYPLGAVAAAVTGYLGEKIGSAGVEARYGNELSGQSRQLMKLGPIAQLFQAEAGNDVRLTIDADIQRIAYDALAGQRGAVVVMDANTGAIIAMVSRPSFDPEGIDDSWDELIAREDSPLLNRATQGLYPPGSTMKVMIADGALDEKITDTGESFECDGVLNIGNSHIRESHGAVHGTVNLEEALTYSCNVTFGTLAMRLKGPGLADTFDRFGFTQEITGDIEESKPHLPDFDEISAGDMAQIGIGQGELLVNPLRMAMLASAYVNEGVVMKPYLVDEVMSSGGTVLVKNKPEKWLTVTSAQRAALINSFMENVVNEGTGGAAYVEGVKVAGKTGTAENAAGDDHGWFIGTAQMDNRNIAFAIIVENSGGGGTVAAPIARRIITGLL